MPTLKYLVSRDASDFASGSPSDPASMHPLLFALFTLIIVGTLCTIALLYLRRKRLAREQTLLPTRQPVSPTSHHRSASITDFRSPGTNDAIFVYDEKMNLLHNSSAPPPTSIPEIRITFPDDDDMPEGEKQKGRVVVVHITDSGSIGMSPLEHEDLPPYEKEDSGRFQSLDLERIGGLREKESPPRWS